MTKNNIDIHMFLWDTINYPENHSFGGNTPNRIPNSKLINEKEIIELYNPKSLKIFKFSDYDELFVQNALMVSKVYNYNKAITVYYSNGGGKNIENRIFKKIQSNFSKFYLLKKCFDNIEKYSKENNIEYVNVCRIRTEFGDPKYKGFYPKINWDKDYNELYLHDWCSTKRINNSYCNWSGAHGNFNHMKVYCNIFDNLYLFINKFDNILNKCWGDDSCVYYLLEYYKIPFILCDINNKEVKKN